MRTFRLKMKMALFILSYLDSIVNILLFGKPDSENSFNRNAKRVN